MTGRLDPEALIFIRVFFRTFSAIVLLCLFPKDRRYGIQITQVQTRTYRLLLSSAHI